MRHYSLFDRLLSALDEGCRVVNHFGTVQTESMDESEERSLLTERQRKHSAGLMRVNHAGEVAAQGLYQGQALTARSDKTSAYMRNGAHQEMQHLLWCAERLRALDSRPSVLTPFWYWGSFGIGCLAGLMGDRWSLSFIKETEDQVVAHLSSHLQRVPCSDRETIGVIERIKADELEHARAASAAGAMDLPAPIKSLMRGASKIMTKSAYCF